MKTEIQCGGCKFINTLTSSEVTQIRNLGVRGELATSFTPQDPDGTMIIEHVDDSPGSQTPSPGLGNQKILEGLAVQARLRIEKITPSA